MNRSLPRKCRKENKNAIVVATVIIMVSAHVVEAGFVVLTIVGLAVTLADQVTDVILGIHYAQQGDVTWSVLTLVLALVAPTVEGFVGMVLSTQVCWRSFLADMKSPASLFGRLLLASRRKRCSCATVCLVVLCVAVFLPMALVMMPLLLLIAPVFGLITILVLGGLYPCTKRSERSKLESSLRGYAIIETLLESVPQLLLQLYIYSISGTLRSLTVLTATSLSLSVLAVWKTVLTADVEVHRDPVSMNLRVPPLFIVTSLFRLVDIAVGVPAAVTLLVYLREYSIAFFVATGILQAAPLALSGALGAAVYMFRCCLCCSTACCGTIPPGKSHRHCVRGPRRCRPWDWLLLPAMLLCWLLLPFVPFAYLSCYALLGVMAAVCCIRSARDGAMKPFNWLDATLFSGKLLPYVEPLVGIPVNWVVTSGPSFLFSLRNNAHYARLADIGIHRDRSDLAYPRKKAIIQVPPQLPLVFTRISILLFAFIIALLIDLGSIHSDLTGSPLDGGFRMLTLLPLYGAVPLSAIILTLSAIDVSKFGHALVQRCGRRHEIKRNSIVNQPKKLANTGVQAI